MKKLVFIFTALLMAVVITGCQTRSNTVRFNTETGEAETIENEENTDEEAMEEEAEEASDEEAMENEEASEEASEEVADKVVDKVIATGSLDALPATGAGLNLSLLISLIFASAYAILTRRKRV